MGLRRATGWSRRIKDTRSRYVFARHSHTSDPEREKQTVQLELKPILDISDIPSRIAVHGTTRSAWKIIETEGLSKMKRNHIHLAQGVGGDSVISGAQIFPGLIESFAKICRWRQAWENHLKYSYSSTFKKHWMSGSNFIYLKMVWYWRREMREDIWRQNSLTE